MYLQPHSKNPSQYPKQAGAHFPKVALSYKIQLVQHPQERSLHATEDDTVKILTQGEVFTISANPFSVTG